MSSSSSKLVGGAAAVAAIGLLITPVPAQARPQNECYHLGGYQFHGGEFIIHYPETGAETRFNAPLGTTVDAPAETFYENGTSLKGRVTGEMAKGGNDIDLTVTRGPKYAPLIIGGAVMPDNTPAGSFRWENRDLQLWDSPTQLPCLPGPPIEDRPPKPDTPKPVVADQPLPAPQQTPAPQETPAPEKAAPLAPEPDQLCIPNPFGLDFPGAC